MEESEEMGRETKEEVAQCQFIGESSRKKERRIVKHEAKKTCKLKLANYRDERPRRKDEMTERERG